MAPSYAVPSVWLSITSDAKLLVSVFGVAFRSLDKSYFESHMPLGMRAPEAFFEPTTPLSFPSDIYMEPRLHNLLPTWA